MPQYDRLYEHFVRMPAHVTSLTVSFQEIEEIVGGSLPSSARRYLAWWSNDPTHSQAQRWIRAGWRVHIPDIRGEVVRFDRVPSPATSSLGQRRTGAKPAPRRSGSRPATPPNGASRDIGGYRFAIVGPIEVRRNENGSVWSHTPQPRYQKAAKSRLNRYGDGEFCDFRVPGLAHEGGVYALFVSDDLKYVGEAVDLHRRWYEYGHISPRKCFEGGQETNCRVNKLIMSAVRDGRPLSLWFHPTQRRKEIEAELRERFRPPWNAV